MELKDGPLRIRPLVEEDGPYLHRWLNHPMVLAYYEGRDNPHDMDMIRRHFLSKQDIKDTLGCLVIWDNGPVGYVQVYEVPRDEVVAMGYEASERVYGMDQFLGEPTAWNQGIGTRMVNLVSRWLVNECRAERVVMDPRIDNARAIHVYEKCGFTRVKRLPQHERHEGIDCDCWLMEWTPTRAT